MKRWFLIGGLALAFMLALGVGALMGLKTGTTQAATLTQGGTSSSQTLADTQGNSNSAPALNFTAGDSNSSQAFAVTPGARDQSHTGGQGQCESLTVSSVNGNTIIAKTASGSSVTIHTTASTQYDQAGKTVSLSAIKVGLMIHVMGTHNSDGSITATSIDID